MDFCVVDQPLCACNIYSELSLEVKAHVSSFYKKTNSCMGVFIEALVTQRHLVAPSSFV